MTIRTKLTTGFKMSSSMVDILREVEQMAKGIRTNRSTFGFWSTSKQCFQITLRIFQFAVATFNHWIYIILWRSLSIHLQSLFLALDHEYCLSLPNSLHVAFCFLAGSEVEGVGSMVREFTSFFLISECWERNKDRRPTFSYIVSKLHAIAGMFTSVVHVNAKSS